MSIETFKIIREYNQPTLPNDKALLSEYNCAAFQELKSNDLDEQTISIFPESPIPYVVGGAKVEYRKVKDKRSGDCKIYFITKDKEYHSFVWHASPRKLRQALRYGILETKSLSLTSKVISALGRNRLTTLERIKEGNISNRYHLKDQLLTHYQDRVEALQGLESLTNQFAIVPDEKTIAKHVEVVNHYILSLKEIQKNIKQDFSEDKLHIDFNRVDRSGVLHLQNEIADDIKRAEAFSKNYKKNIKIANIATGPHSVLTFVKEQMIRDLRRFQNHNQNITYSLQETFALTRGDLNSALEDGAKVIEDYKAPPHDSAFADHHGKHSTFGKNLAYDSSFHCENAEQEKRALLAISFIEGLNTVHRVKGNNKVSYYLKTHEGNSYPLKVVDAIKWGVIGGVLRSIKRMFAYGANIIFKILMGAIELPFTLLVEPLVVMLPLLLFRDRLEKSKLFSYVRDFFRGLRFVATSVITVKHADAPKLGGRHWLKLAARHYDTLGLRVRQLAINAFKNIFQDIFFGIRDIYKQLTIRLFNSIIDDSKSGKDVRLEDLLRSAHKELEQINFANRKDLEALLKKLYKNNQFEDVLNKIYPIEKVGHLKEQIAKHKTVNAAMPASPIGTGEFDDLLNAAAQGFDQFMAFFLHNIHAKHPAAGVLFTVTYLLAGTAVLFPELAARIMSAHYIAYSQGMGYGMSKSPVTAAISSGCTQAQMSSTGFQTLLEGPKSPLATYALEFEKDPFTSITYAAIAVGLGYLLVYQLNFPGLSELLREDMGSFPPSSLAVVAAKIGLVIYEGLAEHSDPYSFDPDHRLILNQGFFLKLAKDEELKKHIEKILLLQFVFSHAKHLPYLSPHTKNMLAQQVDLWFPNDIAKSLKMTFYPEERKSILRTTLSIIFGYPAYLVRIAAAFCTSLALGNTMPLKRATTAFSEKINKDLTRLLRGLAGFLKVGVLFIRRQIKTFADVIINSGLARIEAVVNNTHHIANAAYTTSANLDVGFERVRQLVGTPVDAMVRKVTAAHTTDTQRKTFAAYSRMFKEFSTRRPKTEVNNGNIPTTISTPRLRRMAT